jgi:hypothetical protein
VLVRLQSYQEVAVQCGKVVEHALNFVIGKKTVAIVLGKIMIIPLPLIQKGVLIVKELVQQVGGRRIVGLLLVLVVFRGAVQRIIARFVEQASCIDKERVRSATPIFVSPHYVFPESEESHR